MITSLGEEGAGLCASRAFVCLFCTLYFFLSFFSPSWCQASDCCTLLTFLLTFFLRRNIFACPQEVKDTAYKGCAQSWNAAVLFGIPRV